jgi:glycosyltransferase involved in cell wall biosynthesis
VRAGDRVRVLLPSGPEVPSSWQEDGVEARSFRYAPRRFEVLGYGRSLRSDEAIRGPAKLVAPLYLLAAKRAVARELATGRWDLLHAHWIVPNGVAAADVARRIPMVIGLHGSDVFLAERPWARPLVSRALRRARALTSCSPELARRVEALGFDPRWSRVIPYGVDVGLFTPGSEGRGEWRSRLEIPEDAPVLLGVGRMATKKGFHVLAEVLPSVLSAVPRAHVVLAGGGDLLDELRAATAPLAGRVHFPGPVLHDELPALYRAADLFVLPAVHDRAGNVDGLPNVILEAMASGLPVVASAISGVPLAVVDGETGRLVAENDRDALAAALTELAGDPEQRRRLGAAARAKAEAELTWDAVAARYRAAYDLALSRA